ncbi:MAG: metallophosphoesterase [Deltaproteobacteria bacterium]|nr:metallophosphoesterase [Deltaproteobacteria bacterium]
MLLVHLSDLHLSRYGESTSWAQRAEDDNGWETMNTWHRWHIDGARDRKGRPEKLRLVDPSGVIHKEISWPKRNEDKAVGGLLALAMERHITSAENLIRNRPTPEDLESLLRVDSSNTNLLFLRLVDHLHELQPDVIAITGDITDNGFGYSLLDHYLTAWVESGRMLVVPGNHDTYEMVPRKGRKARRSAKEKRYSDFSVKLGLKPTKEGAWVKQIEDVAFVGMSSCKPPITPLSASGEVSREQLQWLEKLGEDNEFRSARLRIGMVHHHLLRMPYELGGRSPIEVGMRLRNAREVMSACEAASLDIILNGHRHHGYMVQLPGHPMVVSAPSSTLGCKSTDAGYIWTMDLAARHPFPVAHSLAQGDRSLRTQRGRGPQRAKLLS